MKRPPAKPLMYPTCFLKTGDEIREDGDMDYQFCAISGGVGGPRFCLFESCLRLLAKVTNEARLLDQNRLPSCQSIDIISSLECARVLQHALNSMRVFYNDGSTGILISFLEQAISI
jgi:hypothetical protein